MSIRSPDRSDRQVVDAQHSRPARRLGVALAALVVVLIVGHVLWNVAVASRLVPDPLRESDLVASNLPTLVFTVAGGVIIWKQPRNRIGWLLCLVGPIALLLTNLPFDYAGVGLGIAPGSVPAPEVWLSVERIMPIAVFSSILCVLAAIFPDGRLIRPWLRIVWVLLAVHVAVVLPGLLDPGVLDHFNLHLRSPLSLQGLAGYSNALLPTAIGQASFGAAFVLAWGSMIWRYRESDQDERHQIKWLLAAILVDFVAIAGSAIAPLLGVEIPNAVIPVVAMGLPLAIGIAILRYRLYAIDVVLSSTLVYGALAVFITAVYVGIAVGVGTLIGSAGKPNLGLSILATAIVAVGFQPVRERVQKVANRLVYGRRATPYEVLSQFSERVAESYATDDVMPRMARVLAEGTGAQRADVWLRSGTTWREAAVWPVDAVRAEPVIAMYGDLPRVNGTNRLVEVRHQGDLLGALGVTKRIGESLTPVEENLLTHLAGQAGLVLKNVGLTGDLQARVEERRRLERNLHDGAQQHLVALKVKLGLAQMLMVRDPEKARATMTQLKSDADEALETLRDLARGIYPPLLADKGLAVALESQARKATVPVTVEALGIPRYSQDIEAAVYFCCLEALQNIQKYAQASQATIRLREESGVLQFEIQDDGTGFDVATVKKGAGLTNMADRLDALGGGFDLTSAPSRGTTLRGRLPVTTAVSR